MKNKTPAKDMTLDSLAIGSIGSGIAIISAMGDKWYINLIIGLALVAIGGGISYAKYKLR